MPVGRNVVVQSSFRGAKLCSCTRVPAVRKGDVLRGLWCVRRYGNIPLNPYRERASDSSSTGWLFMPKRSREEELKMGRAMSATELQEKMDTKALLGDDTGKQFSAVHFAFPWCTMTEQATADALGAWSAKAEEAGIEAETVPGTGKKQKYEMVFDFGANGSEHLLLLPAFLATFPNVADKVLDVYSKLKATKEAAEMIPLMEEFAGDGETSLASLVRAPLLRSSSALAVQHC